MSQVFYSSACSCLFDKVCLRYIVVYFYFILFQCLRLVMECLKCCLLLVIHTWVVMILIRFNFFFNTLKLVYVIDQHIFTYDCSL